jgi:PPOX class probable F420-dependent enzyme
MSRRKLIELTPEERQRFLHEQRTITLCTIDRHGYPHAVAMWYIVDPDGSLLMTTYAKSQKALNIQRDPKVAVMAETGATYDQLRGVLLRGRAELIQDVDRCAALLARVHHKMSGSFPEGIEEALKAQARKRTIIRVIPERVSSWDHSKLGGTY